MKTDWRKEGRELTRGKVRERDNHTCQDCGRVHQKGYRAFHVHHLNGMCGKKSRGYDSVKDLSGMTTLCPKCHRKQHDKTKYGRRVLPNHREEVFEMRIAGHSYDVIGAKFGVSQQAVYFYINGREPKSVYEKIKRLHDSPLELFLKSRNAVQPSRS